MSSLLGHCHGEKTHFSRNEKRTFSLSQMNNVEFTRTLSWRENALLEEREKNVFVKPNEQCRAYSDMLMARKRTFRRTEKEPFNKLMSMKNRQKTNSFAGYKYLLFVPLAFALVFMTSCKRKTKVQEQVMEGTKVEVKAETGEDTTQIKNAEPTDKAYEVVEQMPTFKGGDAALMKYLSENIKYPETAEKAGEQGRVVVNFIVEKDGAVSNVKVVRSVTPTLDAEAVRVIKAMPKWVPGKQDGKFVRVKYNVPVSFRLQ